MPASVRLISRSATYSGSLSLKFSMRAWSTRTSVVASSATAHRTAEISSTVRGRRVTIDPNANTARPTGSVAVAAVALQQATRLGRQQGHRRGQPADREQPGHDDTERAEQAEVADRRHRAGRPQRQESDDRRQRSQRDGTPDVLHRCHDERRVALVRTFLQQRVVFAEDVHRLRDADADQHDDHAVRDRVESDAARRHRAQRRDDGRSGDEHRQRGAADREKGAEQHQRHRDGGERHQPAGVAIDVRREVAGDRAGAGDEDLDAGQRGQLATEIEDRLIRLARCVSRRAAPQR